MLWWRKSRLDLVAELSWSGGYPAENGHAVLVRGVLSGFPFRPRRPVAHIAFEDPGGALLASASPRDFGRPLVASGPVYPLGQDIVFDALVPGEALGGIEAHEPLDLRVTIDNGGETVAESLFSLECAEPVLRRGPPVMLDLVAWHMVNVATLSGRALERGDLRPMVEDASTAFSLSAVGRETLKGLVKAHLGGRARGRDVARHHGELFTAGWRVDRQIEGFIAAMVGGEVERRADYHTRAHAALLEALASDRIDPAIRDALLATAEAIRDAPGEGGLGLPESLALLGVAAGATRAEIKSAYRRKIRDVHPDRLLDVAPVARRQLEERAKALNAAYSRLLKRAPR